MIQVFQMILALSFLVIIHELGHFTFARIFGVRVEKFYMFFNPWISLVSLKKFDGKWHVRFLHRTEEHDPWDEHPENTEWGIGWVPFGGYCAISGMVDETHDAETVAQTEPQPWEFRSKNVFQRFCIIIGGILVNFLASLLIFGLVLYQTGTTTLPLHNVSSGLYFSEILQQEGFRQQDHILLVNGQEPESVGDLSKWLILEGKRNVTVLRGNDTLQLVMSENLGKRYLALQNEFDRRERQKSRNDKTYRKRSFTLVGEYFPFVIDAIGANTAADFAGMMVGDSIVAVAERETPSYYEVQNALQQHPCDSVLVGFYRNNHYMTTDVFLGDQCLLGVAPRPATHYFPLEHTDYTLLQAIPAGIQYGWNWLVMYVRQFRLVFTKEGAQSVGGFGAIGNLFPETWNWAYFWHITAVISMMLAFMNFLPIPALDGGYILFLIIEMLTGKKPSDKFLEKANNVGFWLLIALLIFANGNDLLRVFF